MYEFTIRLGAIAGAVLAIVGVTTVLFIRPLRHWLADEIDVRIHQHERDHHKGKP